MFTDKRRNNMKFTDNKKSNIKFTGNRKFTDLLLLYCCCIVIVNLEKPNISAVLMLHLYLFC